MRARWHWSLVSSCTSVREAIRQLAAIGLIEGLSRRGFLISKHCASDMLDAFLVLVELEGTATRLAAQRISNELLKTQLRPISFAKRLFQPEISADLI